MKTKISTWSHTLRKILWNMTLRQVMVFIFSHKQSLFTKRNVKNKIVPIYCMSCWQFELHAKTTIIIRTLIIIITVQKMMGKIWGQTSQKKKKKHLYWKKGFYKKGVFFVPDRVMCLYMGLKPGHKTPKPPGQRGLCELHRGREEILRSKDRRVEKEWMKETKRKSKDDRGVGAQNTSTHAHTHTHHHRHIWSPYNIKSCFIDNVENNTKEKLHEIITEPYNLVSRSLRLTCCKKWYLRYMASFHPSTTWKTIKRVWFMRWRIPWLPSTTDMPGAGHVHRGRHSSQFISKWRAERRVS